MRFGVILQSKVIGISTGPASPRPSPAGSGSIIIRQFWVQAVGAVLIAMASLTGLLAGEAKQVRAPEVARQLDLLKGTIATEATDMLRTNAVKGSYTTVWRQFEDLAITALEDILPRHIPGLIAKHFDGGQARAGREKNRLADFAITCGTNIIEISIKAARADGNPENDMGTFRDHPNRNKLFFAAFTLWVRYEDVQGQIRCNRVFFDRTWRFVGKSAMVDGVKYRKKDGNMRPKSWAMFDAGEAFWKSEADFEAAVERAELYRANELIKEYLDDLSDSDQRVLYEKLKGKFGAQTPKQN